MIHKNNKKMYKYSIVSVVLVFILLSIGLSVQGQPFTDRKDEPAVEGHARGSTSGAGASEAIKNERKTKGSSFFRFEWLFGSRHTPPSSNSRNPQTLNGRRGQVNYTTNADFIQNRPSIPIQPTLREQRLATGKWELGVLLGTSHSVTDIQKNKNLEFIDFVDYQASNFEYGFGIFTRYQAASWFALNGGMKYALLTGANKPPADFEYESYSFENNIFEFFLKTEFHAPFLQNTASKAYIFSGVSVYFTEVSLKDGDGQIHPITDDFEQIQPALPFGIGYSYTFSNFISVGYEFGWRYTPFHYLDGVVTDERSYDSYFFNMLTISYPLAIN